ncbi:DUF3269 family protein [Staphylococcus aureus]|uniref:DUF3269 family protein n=1 Tax=Staphylococcus aureus TaxID=1280 RepID=UPI00398C5D85
MVTKEFLKTKLECSDMYAQKLIDEAQGDEKKIMTDSDLKRFKGAHGLLYEQELGLQATIFDI